MYHMTSLGTIHFQKQTKMINSNNYYTVINIRQAL